MFAGNRSRLVWARCATFCCIVGVLLLSASPGWAGNLALRQNNVGGISVDTTGVVGQPSVDGAKNLAKVYVERMERIPDELGKDVAVRKISLKGLDAAVAECLKNNISGTPFDLPDPIRYLGGLQRIEYVLVYPDEHDVVLAGPGEAWRVDERGNVVGVTSGRPVLLLEDLLVALRNVKAARQVAISCSIDPTPEGRKNLQAYLSKQRTFSSAVKDGVEKSLGMQKVTVTGVPTESHLARVMVASDYRMKRIAMNLEPSPVSGLPGFIDMLQSTRGIPQDMMPRWWLACNYEPLAKAENGLAWQIRGPGVKAMTENDLISATGQVTASGEKNPTAQKWANLMTKHYAELSLKDPVFGQLRGVMDLCVATALIDKEHLLQKAGVDLPMLADDQGKLSFDPFTPATSVPSQCSTTKKGRNWIITASGGVDVDVWGVVEKVETDAAVDQTHGASAPQDAAQWWWN